MPASLHSLLSQSRPPELFFPALFAFNLFPLHFPITLWGLDAPYGRFGGGGGWGYVNGNISWAIAESFGPITLYSTLRACSHRVLTPTAKLLIGLYTIHYIHRAVISPLVLSPSRSKQHVVVPLLMALFQAFNGFLLACSLAYAPPLLRLTSPRLLIGVLGWAAGFIGNIYHDEILNDLRRAPAARRVSSLSKQDEEEDKRQGNGRYLIPRAGLFKFVSFPNYLCEIIEWLFFAYIATAPAYPSPTFIPSTILLTQTLFTPVPVLANLPLPSYPALRTALTTLVPPAMWPPALLAPPWLFAVNAAANLLPRAIRGHAWYRRTFGTRFPEERKVIVPYVF